MNKKVRPLSDASAYGGTGGSCQVDKICLLLYAVHIIPILISSRHLEQAVPMSADVRYTPKKKSLHRLNIKGDNACPFLLSFAAKLFPSQFWRLSLFSDFLDQLSD